jgi:HEAT repeat protein
MDDSTHPPPTDRVVTLLKQDAREEARCCLEQIQAVSGDDRKTAVRSLKSVAEDQPAMFESISSVLASFLTDDERSVRLTTAKLFVTCAESRPETVVPVVSSLADRLADDEEFYYVRARCAEALGYVALDHPEAVTSPEILADLRIGLSFDEPEVKEKLAKALEHVALGDPGRLAHQVSSLAEHLDDDQELVRYHVGTALVLVGCDSPETLAAARDALAARLTDENVYVRGRAAEALGLFTRSETTDSVLPESELVTVADDEESFAAERARFALDATGEGDASTHLSDGIGTVESVRGTTQGIIEDIIVPDADDTCPHCGLALPESGPPMCPRCGAPY